MVMCIKLAGNRSPKLNRILISGGGGTGKTTLAAKFASSSDRVLFISTDGNANRQGFMAIDFEFPPKAEHIISNFRQALQIAKDNINMFDVIVIDLIEDFDERAQTLLREELENFKKTMKAWGKINSLYKDMQSLLMSEFRDKTIILLSRDVEEIDPKTGEIIGYKPAIRKTLKNIILKDQDAEIRAYFDKNGNRQFDISNLRYEEMRNRLQNIIHSPIEIPIVNKIEVTEEKVKRMIQKAVTEYNVDDMQQDYWRTLEPQKAYDEIIMFVQEKQKS